MNHKALILSIPIILAIFLLGGWLFLRELKSAPESQNPPVGGGNLSQMAPADFAKYNKTLARHKVTGVKDLEGPYKKVTVSNGTVTFSFEVPDKWLTETRNSGEVTMNEEELREFLGTIWNGDIRGEETCWEADVYDVTVERRVPKTLCSTPMGNYWDVTWDMLKDMPYEEMKNTNDRKRNEFLPGFPNATVSSGMKKAIMYGDYGSDQVNFYILDANTDASYLSDITYSKTPADIREKFSNFEKTFQKEVLRDEDGKPAMEMGNTWGFDAYIKQKNYVVRIWKEAYVEGEFEEGFKHLLDTLSFE